MTTRSSPLVAATAAANSPALAAATVDYGEFSTRELFPGKRLELILGLLRQKRARILKEAAAVSIHPAAIAAVIAWEFSQNVWGYANDILWPESLQQGWGFGSFHVETLMNFRNVWTYEEVHTIRSNPDLAIEAIAQYIGVQRDRYKNYSGIDLSDWPEGLAWLYNTSARYIAASGVRQKKVADAGKKPKLQVENDLAFWTKGNRQLLSWLEPLSQLPMSGIEYEGTVAPKTPPNVRAQDSRPRL
jgi:hypothetical protein